MPEIRYAMLLAVLTALLALFAACDAADPEFTWDLDCFHYSNHERCRLHYSAPVWGTGDWVIAIRQLYDDENNNIYWDWTGRWFVRPDGTEPRPFVIGLGAPRFDAAWSPDGRRIAMAVINEGPVMLFELPEGGVGAVPPTGIGPDDLRVLYAGSGFKHGPTWSPDGRYVGFAAHMAIEHADRGIWSIDVETGEARQFLRPPSEERCPGCKEVGPPDFDPWWVAMHPSWNPRRGNEIAYVTQPAGSSAHRVALYDTTTARVTFIHTAESIIRHLVFSPDGEHLAFSADVPGRGRQQVWVIRRDGTGLRRVAEAGDIPAWSPDGTRLLYRQYERFDPREGQGHLWSVRPDGTGRRQVTFFETFVPPEL